ncbi:HNH endonuclease family protein [Marinobacter hydrocarbonoclasticus]|uniref:HNH endonuclease family protein n=1 Tax=Marinobacter nauticus TaxID=2743 RepID=UPI001C953B3D|nr:HNH endonuclease family protein [Marinobacter nauticus]MBY6195562.1 HNH endonuclease family protein [Marinobacter nauticus]MBY6216705.1 HNH endonuclease family protein [Marinobacter nauticus]
MRKIKKILSAITQVGFVVVLVSQSFSLSSTLPVKQSNSGICHSPESRWYERTTSYTRFDSIESCLDAGGRLPKGYTLATFNREYESKRQGDIPKYQRSAFGHGWDDADRDCQDSRAEVLIDTSTTPVRFADGQRCRVITGRWVSPFTGEVIQNTSGIEIDHLVALRYAWDRGAWAWSNERRKHFANDPINLLPVEASLNSRKQHRGPDEWLPPTGQCGYVARFVRVLKRYDLKPTSQEFTWYQNFLDSCRHK